MDVLIRLKIKWDILTARVSDACCKPRIRTLLLTVKWLAIAFLLYDAYLFGINTGETSLLMIIAVLIITFALRRKGKEIKNEVMRKHKSPPPQEPGMTGVCEKCGVEVSINYGDAYHTLCKNCT